MYRSKNHIDTAKVALFGIRFLACDKKMSSR